MTTICIIPARGGSKRIPKKNIKPFHGKPMIAWTIEAALAADMFEHVLVSTDDPETREVALSYGAACPFLREKAGDDISHISEATHHALEQAQSYYKKDFGTVVQLFANCPIRRPQTLKDCLNAFNENDMNFLISVSGNDWVNPWFSMKMGDNYKPAPLFPEALKQRTQDLPKLYFPNGSIWIAKTDKFLQSRTFYGPGYHIYPVPWQEAVDIDTQEDWDMALAIFELARKQQ